jgi:hypothetical protein|tara:strand:+ start:122 stop:733 length:612 start_codon:yes stop_codon:yes gene_type:complete
MKPDFKRGYCRRLFSWKELEYLINIRPLLYTKRVYILGSDEYRWTSSSWAKEVNCYPPFLFRDAMEKYVCYLADMSRCTKKINDFAEKLEDTYNSPADAHIYMCRNPKLEHPFGIHFDTNPNVIVQCEGKTNFKVWDKVPPQEQRTMLNPQSSPILDVDMKPGDVIWIPEYYPHLATSKTSRLSVSFPLGSAIGFEDRTWVKL